MENSSQNGKQSESTTLTDQMQTPTKSEPNPEAQNSREAVFIRRAKGMPFEEFKKLCIQRFREAGLIKD